MSSNIGCDSGTVKVYDSIYTHVDEKSKVVIRNLFHLQSNTSDCIEIVPTKKQSGVRDCGLYAIAVATALLFGEDPSEKQSDMRNHLEILYFSVVS